MSEQTALNYELIASAAEALVADGESPTLRGVREHLGRGSLATIQKHLATWRERRPAPVREAPRLPDDLMRALAEALERSAAAARSDAEQRLAESQTEVTALAAAAEAVETQRDELAEALESLRSDLERQGGELAAAQKSIAELGVDPTVVSPAAISLSENPAG